MPPDPAPDAVRALAETRAQARRAHDWTTADRLKAEIEAAGWKVVDAGTMYDLVRAVAATIVDAGVVRYGSSDAVPSRLGEPPVGVATVVTVAGEGVSELEQAVAAVTAVSAHAPEGTRIVLVAAVPSPEAASAVEGLDGQVMGPGGVGVEVVRTMVRLGRAAALNAGIRRAMGRVVVVLDPSVQLGGDVVTALVAALDDPAVAVAGPFGLVSSDLRQFEPAAEGRSVVDAIEGSVIAFRRADYIERGPLDERFGDDPYLDAWWSFMLRDALDDGTGRRALVVAGLPVGVAELDRLDARGGGADRGRRPRTGMYRFLKRFATREDLLVDPG
jgi:cysteinyl-tRNA synthetase